MSIFLLAIRSHVLHPLHHHTVTMLYSFSFEARYLVKCYYNIMLQLCSIVTAGTHTITSNAPIFQWYSLYNVSSCIRYTRILCGIISSIFWWVGTRYHAFSQWEETLGDCPQPMRGDFMWLPSERREIESLFQVVWGHLKRKSILYCSLCDCPQRGIESLFQVVWGRVYCTVLTPGPMPVFSQSNYRSAVKCNNIRVPGSNVKPSNSLNNFVPCGLFVHILYILYYSIYSINNITVYTV